MSENDLTKILDEYFNKEKKFIDTSRIPLICQDISQIHVNLEEIKEMLDKKFVTNDVFWPVKTIVYSGVSIILVAVFTAMVYLVIK